MRNFFFTKRNVNIICIDKFSHINFYHKTEAFLDLYQTSIMKCFAKTINGFYLLKNRIERVRITNIIPKFSPKAA